MIEKILERLEEERKTAYCTHERFEQKVDLGRVFGLEKAIDIVQEVAKEYGKDTNVRSNADRIRSMSDEELAEFLKKFDLCTNCKYGEDVRCTFGNPCTHGFATAMAYEWLKSEVKE